MIQPQLDQLLSKHQIPYAIRHHVAAYTAQEIAENAHISGMKLAKTVIVKADNQMKMVVVPAPFIIDFQRLAQEMGAKKVELAREREFRNHFPQCEVGAMPPFGNLFGMEVYVASVFEEQASICFNSGSLDELIEMDYVDFAALVEPVILDNGWRWAGSETFVPSSRTAH